MQKTAPTQAIPHSIAAIIGQELESLCAALRHPSERFSMRLVVIDDSQRLEALVQELSAAYQAYVISIPNSVNDPVLECVRQTMGAKPRILFVQGMDAREDLTPLLQCLEKSDLERWRSHFPASTLVFWLSPNLMKAIHLRATSFRSWCIREHVFVQECVKEQDTASSSTPWDRLKTSGLDSWERMSRLAYIDRRLLHCSCDAPEHDGFAAERLLIFLQMGRFDAVLHHMPALLASCTSKVSLRSLHDLAGLAHIGLHDGAAALGSFSIALSIANELGDTSSIALEKSHLALAHFALNKLKLAKACYVKALKLWKKCSNPRMERIDMANLASLYHREGTTYYLPSSYENALAAAEHSGDLAVQPHILNLLGQFYLESDQKKKALEFHRQALNISNRIGDRRSACASLMNMGIIYAAYTNFSEAEKHYEHALIMSSDCGDMRSSGLVACNLGVLYRVNGMIGKAFECFNAGKEMLEQIGDIRSDKASEQAHELEERIAELSAESQ